MLSDVFTMNMVVVFLLGAITFFFSDEYIRASRALSVLVYLFLISGLFWMMVFAALLANSA